MSYPFDLKSHLEGFGLGGNPLVICKCGRETNADMIRDVRPVKDQLGIAEDYRCDSCLEDQYRTDKLSREEFYVAHDAPPELIEKMAAVDAKEREERDAGR